MMEKKQILSFLYNVDHFLGIVFTESQKSSFPPNDLKVLILPAQGFTPEELNLLAFQGYVISLSLFYRSFSSCKAFATHSLTTSEQRELSQFRTLVGIQRLAILRLGMGSG